MLIAELLAIKGIPLVASFKNITINKNSLIFLRLFLYCLTALVFLGFGIV